MASWLGWNTTEKRQRWLNSLLFPMSCSVTFKPGTSFFSGLSCQSFLIRCKIWCRFHWDSQLLNFRFVLKGTHLLQSGTLSAVVSAAKHSCWRIPLAVWVGCLLLPLSSNLSCYCSSVSTSVARSLLLSAVWVSHEAGSLPPYLFSLSIQLLALAYIDIP